MSIQRPTSEPAAQAEHAALTPTPTGFRSIVFKLALFVSCLLIVAAVAIIAVAFVVARSDVREQIHERLRVAAWDRHKMIGVYVEQQRERAALVASRTRLRQLIEEYDDGHRDAESMRQATQPILEDAKESTRGLIEIWVCDLKGKVITATDAGYLGKDYSGNVDFEQAKQREHLGEPIAANGQYRCLLAAPLMTNDGRPLAVVMILLDATPLEEILSDTDGLGETGEVLVATRDGEQIRYLLPPRGTSRSTVPRSRVPAMDEAIAGEQSVGIVATRYAGVDVLALYGPIEYQPAEYRRWGLLAKIDEAEAYAPVTSLGRILLAIEAALLVVAVAVSYVLARRLTRPIRSLTETATAVAAGDYGARAAIASHDEIGALAAAFDHMADKVAAAQATLEQRVEKRTEQLKREIAERKRTQEQLKAAKEKAEEADRSKGEFLANMSHEIRTPLNGVIGMVELLSATELADEQREYLDLVRQSADALLRLLNDILDFSKIEAGKLELESVPFNLRDCVGKTGQALAVRAAEKGLELACRIAPELPETLLGDPGRLRQVIVNLGGNAIKFTEQGEVVIDVCAVPTASAEPSAEREVGPSAQDGEVSLHFSIRDTGIGVAPEHRQRIFEAFSQADASTTRKYGGTGLGLAISAQLVALMQGRIWLESEAGKGTTFHFTARFALPPGAPEGEPADLGLLRGLRVLIVDDNATNRRILDEVCSSWGMEAAVAPDGPQALTELARAARAGRAYRLVLVDLMMPEMDGFMLAERIQRDPALAEPALVMISSAARPGDVEKCRRMGIVRYLIKPVVQSDLWDVVLEAVGRTDAGEVRGVARSGHSLSRGPRLKVLLVEDSPVNQRVAAGLLESTGHQVVIADNGKKALAALEREPFDVVLMDVQMPEMDGMAATAAIRKRELGTGRHTPIIAMTAAAMEGDRQRCLDAGMDGYVSKPVRPAALFGVLEQVAGGDLGEPAGRDNATNLPPGSTPAESSGAPAPPHDVLDLEAARGRIPGGPEAIAEMARLLLDESRKRLEEIRDALANQDAAHVQRAAHTLRGAADVFAAKAVFEAAGRLERMARDGDLTGAGAAVATLEREVQRLCQSLESLVDSPAHKGGA